MSPSNDNDDGSNRNPTSRFQFQFQTEPMDAAVILEEGTPPPVIKKAQAGTLSSPSAGKANGPFALTNQAAGTGRSSLGAWIHSLGTTWVPISGTTKANALDAPVSISPTAQSTGDKALDHGSCTPKNIWDAPPPTVKVTSPKTLKTLLPNQEALVRHPFVVDAGLDGEPKDRAKETMLLNNARLETKRLLPGAPNERFRIENKMKAPVVTMLEGKTQPRQPFETKLLIADGDPGVKGGKARRADEEEKDKSIAAGHDGNEKVKKEENTDDEDENTGEDTVGNIAICKAVVANYKVKDNYEDKRGPSPELVANLEIMKMTESSVVNNQTDSSDYDDTDSFDYDMDSSKKNTSPAKPIMVKQHARNQRSKVATASPQLLLAPKQTGQSVPNISPCPTAVNVKAVMSQARLETSRMLKCELATSKELLPVTLAPKPGSSCGMVDGGVSTNRDAVNKNTAVIRDVEKDFLHYLPLGQLCPSPLDTSRLDSRIVLNREDDDDGEEEPLRSVPNAGRFYGATVGELKLASSKSNTYYKCGGDIAMVLGSFKKDVLNCNGSGTAHLPALDGGLYVAIAGTSPDFQDMKVEHGKMSCRSVAFSRVLLICLAAIVCGTALHVGGYHLRPMHNGTHLWGNYFDALSQAVGSNFQLIKHSQTAASPGRKLAKGGVRQSLGVVDYDFLKCSANIQQFTSFVYLDVVLFKYRTPSEEEVKALEDIFVETYNRYVLPRVFFV